MTLVLFTISLSSFPYSLAKSAELILFFEKYKHLICSIEGKKYMKKNPMTDPFKSTISLIFTFNNLIKRQIPTKIAA
jgi:hypothetical protein